MNTMDDVEKKINKFIKSDDASLEALTDSKLKAITTFRDDENVADNYINLTDEQKLAKVTKWYIRLVRRYKRKSELLYYLAYYYLKGNLPKKREKKKAGRKRIIKEASISMMVDMKREGMSQREIAKALNVSPATVNKYLKKL